MVGWETIESHGRFSGEYKIPDEKKVVIVGNQGSKHRLTLFSNDSIQYYGRMRQHMLHVWRLRPRSLIVKPGKNLQITITDGVHILSLCRRCGR